MQWRFTNKNQPRAIKNVQKLLTYMPIDIQFFKNLIRISTQFAGVYIRKETIPHQKS